MKAKLTVTSFRIATTIALFGMCDCTDDSDVGTSEFLFVLGILHVYGCAHMSPDMD